MADDTNIFGDIFNFILDTPLPWDYSFEDEYVYEDEDEYVYEDEYEEEFPNLPPYMGIDHYTERAKDDFWLISWREIQELLQTENPTVREALETLVKEIDESRLDYDQIDTLYFARPIIGRTVIDPETGLPTFEDQYVGFQDSAESMLKAKADLETKGVEAPSGGGGGGGSYYISEITSDQWQRIRRGEIDEEEAEWENDEDNYDEDGELRDFGVYADEDEDEDS
mgnify:CR=1 FL=1|tara:strand:+ start:514 stop:1188 length:675 start_codon:yes stop_codon:yes gene_type:complete